MGSSGDAETELTDVQRFTLGLTVLIWSLTCAIFVGSSSSGVDPQTVDFVAGAGLLLLVLPPVGAYLLINGIKGILREHNVKPD
jgi:hypothetical protein